jgi:S1-C subfamily serine protease
MKRTIAALLISLSLSIPTIAASWFSIAQDLSQSVYRLSMVYDGANVGSCSGFVIDQRTSNMLTAAHCVPEGLEVQVSDGTKAEVLFKDDAKDVAVLKFPRKVLGQSLRPGKVAKTTDEVMAAGYPFGADQPVFQSGRVAQSVLFVGPGDDRVIVQPAYNGGMSGGPVVDATGKVVSIVQISQGSLGAGINIDKIRSVTKPYWQYDR